MKYSVIKHTVVYQKTEKEGQTETQITTNSEVLASGDFVSCFSVYISSKKSLEELIPSKFLHNTFIVYRVEYEEKDGFILTRDLSPKNFGELEKTIMDDMKFSSRQAILNSIAANLNALNLHSQSFLTTYSDVNGLNEDDFDKDEDEDSNDSKEL